LFKQPSKQVTRFDREESLGGRRTTLVGFVPSSVEWIAVRHVALRAFFCETLESALVWARTSAEAIS